MKISKVCTRLLIASLLVITAGCSDDVMMNEPDVTIAQPNADWVGAWRVDGVREFANVEGDDGFEEQFENYALMLREGVEQDSVVIDINYFSKVLFTSCVVTGSADEEGTLSLEKQTCLYLEGNNYEVEVEWTGDGTLSGDGSSFDIELKGDVVERQPEDGDQTRYDILLEFDGERL